MSGCSDSLFGRQEFHGIIYQGNREYLRGQRPGPIWPQPIKMFWWIDHLIVMFPITFSIDILCRISDVMIGPGSQKIVFPDLDTEPGCDDAVTCHVTS